MVPKHQEEVVRLTDLFAVLVRGEGVGRAGLEDWPNVAELGGLGPQLDAVTA